MRLDLCDHVVLQGDGVEISGGNKEFIGQGFDPVAGKIDSSELGSVSKKSRGQSLKAYK